jgi:DNA repair protein RadC
MMTRDAKKLAELYPNFSLLLNATEEELRNAGLSEGKVKKISEAIELYKAIASEQQNTRKKIGSPQDVADLLKPEMASLEQEHLKVVLLNTRNTVIKVITVYVGTISGTTVRICEIFREAIRKNARAIIVVHNHPSGDPTPSQEDIRLTKQLKEAGQLLEVELIDHIIIGETFISLKEKGII